MIAVFGVLLSVALAVALGILAANTASCNGSQSNGNSLFCYSAAIEQLMRMYMFEANIACEVYLKSYLYKILLACNSLQSQSLIDHSFIKGVKSLKIGIRSFIIKRI